MRQFLAGCVVGGMVVKYVNDNYKAPINITLKVEAVKSA